MSKRRKPKNTAKKGGFQPKELAQSIINFLEDHPTESFSEKKIAEGLNIRSAKVKKAMSDVLLDLEVSGAINRAGRRSYASAAPMQLMEGVIDHVNAKFAYIVHTNEKEDPMVSAKDLNGALDGDKVRFVLGSKGRGGRRSAKVTEILERARTQFVGKLERSPRFAFVVPDYRKMHYDFFIAPQYINGAEHNDKVVVEIIKYPEKGDNPEAKVLRVLGPAGEHEAEIHSIIEEFGLPNQFPDHVQREAEAIPEKIPAKDIEGRMDFRDITTFTIDPADAKDFDDALSLKKIGDGKYEVGIHIADVTHYLKPDTELDKEAVKRATSVYLVDRTIPMLPEKLSNNLCSLRPNEDRLAFSAVVVLDDEANVLDCKFGRSIIHSNHRFVYDDAQDQIDSQSGEYYQELTLLNDLAKKLRAKRFQAGSINFETTEVKFKLDEKGKPLGVITKVRKDIHKMIEEFMLLANKRVAEWVHDLAPDKGGPTFVYRTHDYPNPEKVDIFSKFITKFGHELKVDEAKISESMNRLLEKIEGRPEQNILESLAIRTMAKAKYTTEPKLHFGLAFPHYSHFTSPIRRYPDVMVHRLLQHYLDKGKPADKEKYEKLCEHSSEMEKRATEAERASIKFKQVEFMKDVGDKVFEGIVSGVTEWGIFVEVIETKVEGMVRLTDLKDDFYEFDEKNYRIVGRSNKKMISLGDKVSVQVQEANVERRTIDFIFADTNE
ncbi:MAG: ribonuclease R [Cyclobacteriaceae bacterium]|nr:ribonuclease R [Cyclobacteriaceae bacterium]MCH8514699.1 ribonuclease R [Cyclobacteriaceae bacterium]